MAITEGTRRGGNKYARAYDRLRKHSQRTQQAVEAIEDEIGRRTYWGSESQVLIEAGTEMEARLYGVDSRIGDPTWHTAYVRGVRDALSLISAMQEDA